jgi:mannose-6-phosphate isomerase-like protein (cupin superfamily)
MNEIQSKKNAPSYTWGDHCLSWVLNDSEGLSVKQEQMPAGTSEQLHYHREATQFFYILNGTAIFYIDGERIIAGKNQGITIAKKQQHLVKNETGELLEFLVVSQPSTQNDRINV